MRCSPNSTRTRGRALRQRPGRGALAPWRVCGPSGPVRRAKSGQDERTRRSATRVAVLSPLGASVARAARPEGPRADKTRGRAVRQRGPRCSCPVARPWPERPGPKGQERTRREVPRSVGVENRTWTGPNNSSGRPRARSVKDYRHHSNDRLWTTLGIDQLRLGMTLWILSTPSVTVTLRHLPDSGLSVTSWSLSNLSTAGAPLSPGRADLSPRPWGLCWLLGRSSTTN
jgi:hypothetical protein